MSTWFAVNRVILNIYKTNYILFGKRMLSRDVVIHIRNVNIERVRVVKFLGMYVDDLLNWNYHITYVKSKLSKSIGIICRYSHLLNRSSMHILYCSLLLPYWGNTYLTNINGVVLLQNNYFALCMVPFLDIIELQTVLFMYKAYYSCLPSNIQRIVDKRETTYSLRACYDLQRIRVHSTLRSMNLCVYGVRLWIFLSNDTHKT